MGIASTIKSVVKLTKGIFGDLLFDVVLIKRIPVEYIPGEEQQYEETEYPLKGCITNKRRFNSGFTNNEDKDLDSASDIYLLLYVEENIVAEPNDIVTFGEQTYRVIYSEPTFVGNEAVVYYVQIRHI